jgi:DNA-binding transcriptional LysR family regulator
MMICAAPSDLARAGVPHTPAELAAHQCLGFTHWGKHGEWRMDGGKESAIAFTGGRFRSNNGQALRMAALQGFGIVMQPEVLIAEDVAAGRLVSLLAEHLPAARAVHLVYARDRLATPKLTTFVEFVLARFGRGLV